ncbi:MAG: mannose-1-phosphate guanylyltransferase/mannose-6-phosphate isomerase, partial [Burkholderiaceae bacterium]
MTSTETIHVTPVILAGGSGTRLWPLSRARHPKQFLVLSGSTSLFQQAVDRVGSVADPRIRLGAPLVVGNEEHRFLVLDQLLERGIRPSAVLLEPCGRNTAPAVTLAALQALEGGDDPVLVVTSADQTVTDPATFTAAVQRAVLQAAEGGIVILGITPDRPETAYGYIGTRGGGDAAAALQVQRFVEKPDLATAERYLAEGGYFWNAGMFVLRASVWMRALAAFRPDIAEATRAAWAGRTTDAQFVRPAADAFAAVPSESVDYAVMEHCAGSPFEVRMVPLDAGWSDLGAWDAVWQVSDKDDAGNAGHGDAMFEDSRNSLVHATSRLVSVVGLDDVVVVETPDAVMVTRRDRSQQVKQIVNRLDAGARSEQTLHRQVHRPWGWYDSIDHGARFQVKRILVKPGASL